MIKLYVKRALHANFTKDYVMGIWELLLTAIGLSMDAFAVSVCKGLSVGKATKKQMALTGAWFGGFQALMPLIGYLIGKSFASFITSFDHWIAFALLALIGLNMIKESFSNEENCQDCSFAVKVMLVMAIATSIDALAVGITFALLPEVNIFATISFIGIITFILSALGVKFGAFFGAKYKRGAEILGGSVLVLMGTKILLEHLGIINF
jgi:putative Mn2+ efflux pump MntP